MAAISITCSLGAKKIALSVEGGTTAAEVSEMARVEAKAPEGEYSLFVSPGDYKDCAHIPPTGTMDEADVLTGDALMACKRMRDGKFVLPTGDGVEAEVDESLPVATLAFQVATLAGCAHPAVFGLKMKGTDHATWLDPSKPLRAQGVGSNETLMLKQRLYPSGMTYDSEDALKMAYAQHSSDVLRGVHALTEEEVVEVAAYAVHLMHGDAMPGFGVSMDGCLPTSFAKKAGVLEKVEERYNSLIGTSAMDARRLYIEALSKCRTYGLTLYKVEDTESFEQLIFGISAERIVLYEHTSAKTVVNEWPFSALVRCACTGASFTLDLTPVEEDYVSVGTGDGAAIQFEIAQYTKLVAGESIAPDASSSAAVSAQPGKPVSLKDQRARELAENRRKKKQMLEQAKAEKERKRVKYSPDGTVLVEAKHAEDLKKAGFTQLGDELDYARMALEASDAELKEAVQRAQVQDEKWRRNAIKTVRVTIHDECQGVCVSTSKLVAAAVILTTRDFRAPELMHAVVGVADHVSALSTAGKAVCSLERDDQSDTIIEACEMVVRHSSRIVAAATVAASSLANGDVNFELRGELLEAAQAIGTSCWLLLQRSEAQMVTNTQHREISAKMDAVGREVTVLIASTRTLCQSMHNDDVKDRISSVAQLVWTGITQLMATCKLCAPVISAKAVVGCMEGSCGVVDLAVDAQLKMIEAMGVEFFSHQPIAQAVAQVHGAIDILLECAREIGEIKPFATLMLNQQKVIHQDIDFMIDAIDSAPHLMHYIKTTGEGCRDMVNIMKNEAEEHEEQRVRLEMYIQKLSDYAAAMLDNGKKSLKDRNKRANDGLVRSTIELKTCIQEILENLGIVMAGFEEDDFAALVLAAASTGENLAALAQLAGGV